VDRAVEPPTTIVFDTNRRRRRRQQKYVTLMRVFKKNIEDTEEHGRARHRR
jgi:hypothetical protein